MDKKPSKAKQEWDAFCWQLADATAQQIAGLDARKVIEVLDEALHKAGLQSWKNCMAMTKRRQPDKGSA